MNIETTILVAFKPAWPMPKEDEYNYWWAPSESHQLQEVMSDIEAGRKAIHEGLQSATALENIWYKWPFQEKLTR